MIALGKYILVQNPPMQPLDTKQLDYVYSLPYERWYPKCYESLGGVPGINEVLFSITHNRGCFGAYEPLNRGLSRKLSASSIILFSLLTVTALP